MTKMEKTAQRETAATRLSAGKLSGFALGSVGTGMFMTLPGLVLLIYLTNILNVSPYFAGLAVGIPKAWDVLFDPVAGAISDREAARTGRRTRLMLLGALTLPAAFILMFSSPFEGNLGAVWVGGTFMLAATAFALFQVPYVALPTEISSSASERSRAMTWRLVAVTIGILLAGGSTMAIVSAAGGHRHGYRVMGIVFAVVMCVTMLIAATSTRWIESRRDHQSMTLIETFRVARGNKPFFALLAAYVIQCIGTAIFLAAITYVAVYFLGDLKRAGPLFVAIIAPGIVAVPLWAWLGNRWGRARAYLLASAVYALAFLSLYPVLRMIAVAPGQQPSMLMLLIPAGLVGVCYAGQQVLPTMMVPDAIIVDARRTGHMQAGAFNGAWSALETASYAIGPTVFSLMLGVAGYVPSASLAVPVAQSSAALNAILTGLSFVPAAFVLAGVPFIWWYSKSDAALIGDARGPDAAEFGSPAINT